MYKITLAACLALASAFALGQIVISASHSYQIETSGTYSADGKYFDFGSYNSGQYLSFGAFDFNASSLANLNIAGATLSYEDATYSRSTAGNFTIWAVTNNSTDLSAGQSTITYDSIVTGGYSNQLGTATSLGTFDYSANVLNAGSIEDLTLSQSGLSALNSLAHSSNSDIRLVLTGDGTSYVSMNGAGTTSPYSPELSLQTEAVPSPGGIIFFGMGIAGIALRRKK